MKSARTFSEHQAQNCDSHQFCVHQHYQKCQKERQRQIRYTMFPKQNLNALVNVHPKCTNQYSYNFKTLAYEKFSQGKQPETESQRNFVKNFYLENVPQQMCMTNQIVKELEDQVFPFNAYNLAEGATKDYYAFEYKRQQYLVSARRRAKINSNQFVKELKQQKEKSFSQRAKWIQKILATIQDLGQRMFNLNNSNKQNESQNGKQRIFLNQKSHVNEKYLKQIKIKDSETSMKIFEDLRALMLKKKKKYQDERIKNKNVNLNSSEISQTMDASAASQSMISAVSQVDKQQTDEEIINNLCDFEKLKKKWKTLDVQRIKDLILSTLTRKIIWNCETEKAKRIFTYERQCLSVPSHKKNGSTAKKQQKRSSTVTKQPEVKIVQKNQLSKNEAKTKQQMMSSGLFDSAGSRYEKTRNFSQLFNNKEKSMRMELSFVEMDSNNGRTVNFFKAKEQQSTLKQEPKLKGYKTARTTALRL